MLAISYQKCRSTQLRFNQFWYVVTGLPIPTQRNSDNVLSSIVVFQQLQWVLLPKADSTVLQTGFT